jgi:hypothetical protein
MLLAIAITVLSYFRSLILLVLEGSLVIKGNNYECILFDDG